MPACQIVKEAFYLRPFELVAPDLLGKLLCSGEVILRITEVEAYGGMEDSASHCRFGKTPRNEPMWGAGGRCYVYLCYGIHNMLNVVTGHAGEGAAVLIRSCDVLGGLDRVRQRRKLLSTQPLCDGPGKVAQALAIDKNYNHHPIFECGGLELREGDPPSSVKRSKRIGIAFANERDQCAPMRFIGNFT